MLQYIFKRLLIMIPTFMFILLVVFIVINLAPGNPTSGAGGGSGSESADQSANAREGMRLFKEQYNLDKPIFLNTRFWLEPDDVIERLEVIALNMSGTVPGETEAHQVGALAAEVIGNIANQDYVELQNEIASPDTAENERDALREELQLMEYVAIDPFRPERPEQGDVFDAEERVENWGNVIVRHLIPIANEYVYLVPPDATNPFYDGVGVLASDVSGLEPDSAPGTEVSFGGASYVVHGVMTQKVRFLAVQRLSVNARRRVVVRDGERADEEQLELNREIQRENNQIADWTYELGASAEERAEILALWDGWWDENHERYEYTTGEQWEMFFLDTRFAKYCSNLFRFRVQDVNIGPITLRLPLPAPNLGTSIRYRRPVIEVIGEHWRYSIFLSLASLFLAYFISIPLGVLAAVKQNQFADRGIGLMLFVLYSLPSFFVATLLSTYLTDAREILPEAMRFPVGGFMEVDPEYATTWQVFKDIVWHMVLPVISLTYASLAVLSRYARTGLLDVIRSDYIRTARAKGLPEWIVILKHAVRNGMIPILTLLGTTLPVLIGGSIIIEYVFTIDGMGKLMIIAIQFRDFNVIMGVLLISAVLTLLGILLSDISYALVDPRISFD